MGQNGADCPRAAAVVDEGKYANGGGREWMEAASGGKVDKHLNKYRHAGGFAVG
jgi:hypothetical protein